MYEDVCFEVAKPGKRASFEKIARPYVCEVTKTITFYVLVSAFLGGLAAEAAGDVWKRNEAGELTLHRTLDQFQRERLAADWRPPTLAVFEARQSRYAEPIERVANHHGVDANLVRAIIEVESAYDHLAVSKAGAQGLMQLMPQAIERFAVVDPLDPDQNIDAGVRYLRILTDEFQDLQLVLAAYNAGEEAVRHFESQVPPYPETRAYVDRVLLLLRKELVAEGR